MIALDTAFLVGGVIITEQIFSISGMGQAFLDALGAGDAPFLLGWFLVGAVVVIVFNLIADIALRRARSADPAVVSTPRSLLPTAPIDEPELAPGAEPVARTNWQLFRRRFFRHRLALVSIAVLAILMIALLRSAVARAVQAERAEPARWRHGPERASTGSAPTTSATTSSPRSCTPGGSR